jgi:hypothetical protein
MATKSSAFVFQKTLQQQAFKHACRKFAIRCQKSSYKISAMRIVADYADITIKGGLPGTMPPHSRCNFNRFSPRG